MNTSTKNAISQALFTKGAYLVSAHGTLASPNKIHKKVPPNTVIYFMADPGYCLSIPAMLGVQNEFFTSKQKLYNFLYRAGNAVNKPRTMNITHVYNIHGRIRTPGQEYLDMYVNLIPNTKHQGMGYVKPLPTNSYNKIPTFNKVVPLLPGEYLLSNLLKTRFSGGGVFIISSCRAIPGNNTNRFKIRDFKGAPMRGTPWTDPITRSNQFKPTIKGRPMRRKQLNLNPSRSIEASKSKYPPATLRKLREAVTTGKKNLWTALLDPNIKARADIWSRKPGEVAFLQEQVRLAQKPLSKVRVLRSGSRSLRK